MTSKGICKDCVHNCTDNIKKSCSVKNGWWCNAGYGRVIKKGKKQCQDYESRSKRLL